jgi:hypothetical protein
LTAQVGERLRHFSDSESGEACRAPGSAREKGADSSPAIQGCVCLLSDLQFPRPFNSMRIDMRALRICQDRRGDRGGVSGLGRLLMVFHGQDRDRLRPLSCISLQITGGPLQGMYSQNGLMVDMQLRLPSRNISNFDYEDDNDFEVWLRALRLGYPRQLCQRPVALAYTNLTLCGDAGAPKQLSEVLT